MPPVEPGTSPTVVAVVGLQHAALARLLIAEGCRMVLIDRDMVAGHRLVLELNTGNAGMALFIPGSGDHALDAADAVAEAQAAWGRCDRLYNGDPDRL